MFRIIHHNRWFFWTIAVLLFAGLGLVLFIFKDAQYYEEFAREFAQYSVNNWRTYRSSALGIAVRYPSSWQIEIDQDDSMTVYFENSKDFSENISVSVKELGLESVIRNSLKISSEEEIFVGGIRGMWIKGSNPRDPATSNVILVRRGDMLYYIAGQAKAFEKIVDRIRFVEIKN
ncbi:MAG: hypothetical protein U1C57_02270 [Candidatus Doudnabacteria bacterium]|nr:hypothetical protein [Candidatus Doudnabacteria bacterium]